MSNDLRRAEEAVEKMVDALYSALPFVEDMAGSEYYKKGFPEQMVKRVKDAIAAGESLRASQAGEPCGKCDSATEYLGECPHSAPTPPAEEAGPCGECHGRGFVDADDGESVETVECPSCAKPCDICRDTLLDENGSPCPSCAPSTEKGGK